MTQIRTALWLAIAMAGCSRPPALSSTIAVERDGGMAVIKVSARNIGHAPTTPIAVEVIATPRTGGAWGQPLSVIRPAPFVLNRREKRDLIARMQTDADFIRTRLIIREAENGHLLKDEAAETAVHK